MQLTTRGDEHPDHYGTGEHTTSELERIKRELSASLALSAPGSHAHVLITRHLQAVRAELSQRPDGEGITVMHATAAGTREWAGTFTGTPSHVAHARHAVAGMLAGYPRADDAILIVSELASNAVTHSHSKDQSFTVRAEIYPGYLWLEVEDHGGPWNLKPRDTDRPHGLDVVEALTGPDNWGVDGSEARRVVWCRLEPEAQP